MHHVSLSLSAFCLASSSARFSVPLFRGEGVTEGHRLQPAYRSSPIPLKMCPKVNRYAGTTTTASEIHSSTLFYEVKQTTPLCTTSHRVYWLANIHEYITGLKVTSAAPFFFLNATFKDPEMKAAFRRRRRLSRLSELALRRDASSCDNRWQFGRPRRPRTA